MFFRAAELGTRSDAPSLRFVPRALRTRADGTGARCSGLKRRVVDFKVMLRPLKAVNLIRQKMGAMLARRP
jgi:hypothetical protein